MKKLKKYGMIILSVSLIAFIMLAGCEDGLELQESAGIVGPFLGTTGQTFTNNVTGQHDGYDYELWKDSGTTSMTLRNGGNFDCSWSNINNALFRKGRKWTSANQTHSQIGNISVQYSANYNPNGNSYLGIYGWTKNPLVEYYIIDSWGSWRPPGSSSKGTVNIDGGTYDIYETTRTNEPSIEGTRTFQQYWAVRTSKRTSGTISVSEHFRAWEARGMRLGGLYEVSLNVEGWQSSGNAQITSHYLNIGGSSSGGSSSGSSSGGSATTCPAGHPKAYYNADGHNCSANCGRLDFEAHNYVNNVCTGCGHNRSTGSTGGSSSGSSSGGTTSGGSATTCPAGHPKAYYNADGHNCSANCGRLDFEAHNYVNNVCTGCGHNRSTGSSSGSSSGNTSGGTSSNGNTYNFSQLSFQSNQGVSSYSVSNGALNVNFGGQYKEVRYNLPQGINLSNINQISVSGSSANGQVAIKFFNSAGQEIFVMWNNRGSNQTWTKTLSSSEKNNTVTRIGIMSQDTNNYSATINSITFR